MIICKDGELQIQGQGEDVASEVGCIMQYFFEHCSAKEATVALAVFKHDISQETKVNFIAALAMIMQ